MSSRSISKNDTYIMFAAMLVFIGTCVAINISLLYAFAGAILVSAGILIKNGYSISEIAVMMWNGIKSCSIIYIIIVLMGTTISIWLASGIVPTLIYYGFQYISNTNYLLACFLVATVVAAFMGTALGTFSTIGMALYGIGRGLGIPSPILIGAIVSGAFVADKISPISSLTNLTLNLTGVQYKDYIKTAVKTLIPTIILSAAAYWIIGMGYSSTIEAAKLMEYQKSIGEAFYVSPILLLFPVIVVVLAVIGVKILPNMGLGVAAGIALCVFLQKMSLSEVFNVILYGYKSTVNMQELSNILKGGGIIPMLEVIFIVMSAIALGSIFEGANIIKPIIDNMVGNVTSRGRLILKTGILSIILTTVTCDQTVGILFPAKFLKEKYEELGVGNDILARTISDSGIIIAPLMAWNVNAIIITVITGISAMQFAPYTVLCYIAPLVTFAAGYIKSLKKAEKGLSV